MTGDHAAKPRHERVATVTSVTDTAVTTDDGWTFIPPSEHLPKIKEGDRITVETRGLALVTGCRGADGEWLWRRSDEWLTDDDAVMRLTFARDRAERLRDNRDEWARREQALPSWVRDRLGYFRVKGGRRFETDGWGYELVVAELAVLYAGNGVVEDDTVREYAHAHGVSGNQDGCAKALAGAHVEDADWSAAGTPSALTPITGDPYYADTQEDKT